MLATIPYFEVPVLNLGPLPIHGFGVLVALGFLLGGNVAMQRAARSGLDGDRINQVLTWLVIGTFVGGHFGYGLMYAREEYLANPINFLKFWQGLSSFGGFVVCVPLAFWFFRKNRLPMWHYMDALAFGMGLGWFLGRMGCTVAHDHPGTPSDFFLAKYCRPVQGHTLELPSFLTLDQPHDLRWGPCRDGGAPVLDISNQVDPAVFEGVMSAHDMGFYEALWSLGVFALFLVLERVRDWKPGFFVTLLGVLYAPVRFSMDYLRPEDTDNRWFADTALQMTPGQFWSIVFFVAASYGLYRVLTSSDRPYGVKEPLRPEEGGFDNPEVVS